MVAHKANAIHFSPEIIELIDNTMTKCGGYSTRAEFVREAVRSYCRSRNGEPNE
jgi:Arc/MetJ-type ribon-helix-helix transcriptional regulator